MDYDRYQVQNKIMSRKCISTEQQKWLKKDNYHKESKCTSSYQAKLKLPLFRVTLPKFTDET